MDIPVSTLIKKIDDLTAKLETASSKCLHLGKKKSAASAGVTIDEDYTKEVWETREE